MRWDSAGTQSVSVAPRAMSFLSMSRALNTRESRIVISITTRFVLLTSFGCPTIVNSDVTQNFVPRCYHCKTAIIDERFITLDDDALGKRTYHEQHFFCAECGDPFLPPSSGSGGLTVTGDGEFNIDDDVGFTVYKGHPYCEACHVRLRMPKCKRCKKSIRDGMRAVEALGGKWCWECFVCEVCDFLVFISWMLSSCRDALSGLQKTV